LAKYKQKQRINNDIRSLEVRLVSNNIEPGIYSIKEAKNIAYQLNLDLVEINENTKPPIVKIIDYNKFLYENKKREKELKKKQKENKIEMKELRFTPHTDEHDFLFKLKHAKNFLKKGNMVRGFVFFRGREISFPEKGKMLLLRFADELSELGTPENIELKLIGRKMVINIKPKKKNN